MITPLETVGGSMEYKVQRVPLATVCEDAPRDRITAPAPALAFWRSEIERAQWYDEAKECMVVLALDRKNGLIGWNLVSLGSATGTTAHPREIFRPVIVAGATAFMLMHNHPSGDPGPSMADMAVTRQCREAAKLLDVAMLDHVVVGRVQDDPNGKGYYSFRETGLL